MCRVLSVLKSKGVYSSS